MPVIVRTTTTRFLPVPFSSLGYVNTPLCIFLQRWINRLHGRPANRSGKEQLPLQRQEPRQDRYTIDNEFETHNNGRHGIAVVGGLVVIVLANGPNVNGFKSGRG
jgi:hypothetical protein